MKPFCVPEPRYFVRNKVFCLKKKEKLLGAPSHAGYNIFLWKFTDALLSNASKGVRGSFSILFTSLVIITKEKTSFLLHDIQVSSFYISAYMCKILEKKMNLVSKAASRSFHFLKSKTWFLANSETWLKRCTLFLSWV